MGDSMNKDFLITKIEQVIFVEKEKYKEKRLSFSNKLNFNELIFHYSGHSTVYFDEYVLRVKENTIRFLPEGAVKKYEVERESCGECIDIFFTTDKPVSDCAFTIDASQKEYIGKIFKRLFNVWIEKQDGYYFECVSLLYKIFSELQKNAYSPSDHYLKIKPAIEEINKEFLNKSFSNRYLASLCNISESYMKKLFKEKYGASPKRYIIQRKIDYACELLALQIYTITQISEMSNFSDVYYFSRQFKEYIGVSPNQYVKKYKSSN